MAPVIQFEASLLNSSEPLSAALFFARGIMLKEAFMRSRHIPAASRSLRLHSMRPQGYVMPISGGQWTRTR
jgi:hypothetical protein